MERALDQIQRLFDGITPEQEHLPTPCRAWDVRQLANHIVGEVHYFAVVTAGGERKETGEDFLGDDWPAAFRASAGELRQAWRDPGVADRMIKLPYAEVTAEWTAGQQIAELAVHAWDLATATGRPTDLDPEVGAAALAWSHDNIRPEFRGNEADGYHIGPEVTVPDDAPLYDRIAAFGGRQP
ncbi:TIGR03086 family metal-binding protein [Nonomuraea soli]|uniref:Uncharacterized protein (TIGR03086 family) n=1 Tax=Nonomuraea soli TaxID=1032476 RepID=A0A7W0CG97_9ACTN|nr:TIGR03086 family metal-binding protein [Nonomuraea soli]MBA2890459.1 uncharacterized protein (TIGR03086 family) [Nonomuraea soli]